METKINLCFFVERLQFDWKDGAVKNSGEIFQNLDEKSL